jgi:histidinol-phosphate aminotransferase
MNGPKVNPQLLNRIPYKIPNQKCPIKLDTNENMFPCHPSLKDIQDDFHLYPDPTLSNQLKEKIANHHSIEPNQILLCPGSDMGLKLILEAYSLPDTTTLVVTPNYSRFTYFLQSMYTYYKELEVNQDSFEQQIENELSLEYGYIHRLSSGSIPKYNLVYISHPNLPLGYTLTISWLVKQLKSYPETMFIVDEAYLEYSNSDSMIPLIKEYNNLIVVKTFSKAFGLAGLRIGYIMSHPQVIHLLNVLANDKSVTNFAMKAASLVLDHYDFYQEQINQLKVVRQWFCEELDKLNIKWIGGTTNFVLVTLDKKWKEIFLNHGIGVKIDYQGMIRITIGTQAMMNLIVSVIKLNVK